MSTMRECADIFRHYSRARIPFVVFDTIEVSRALDIIKSVSDELSMRSVYVHSVSKGMYDISTQREVDEDKSLFGALTFIAEQMKHKQQLTFILTEASGLDNENADTRQLLGTVNAAIETGGMIVAITSSPVWNQLRRTGMRLKLDFPDEREMLGIIREMLDNYRGSIRIDWDDNDMRVAAQLLAGVSQIEAENVILSLLANQKVEKKDLDELRFVKDRLFSDISGLERIQTSPRDAEVGGLGGLQAWLDERQKLLQDPTIREALSRRGLPPPRGVLLVGVPGCGKSVSAKAIAARWKMPLYRLDFATVQGSYVGQSEQQLKEALVTAEQVSPCILWIDEIEKGLSGAASADGGVSTRMVGQFLFWLQECRKFVFVVATANDVSMLPAELLRRGRFDEIFFVDLPNLEERRTILQLHYRNYVGEDMSPALLDKLADISEGFTGADLESAMRDAGYYMQTHDGERMSEQAIVAMVTNIIPLSRTNPEKIEAIRAWGRERAVPASGRSIGGGDTANPRQFGRRIINLQKPN